MTEREVRLEYGSLKSLASKFRQMSESAQNLSDDAAREIIRLGYEYLMSIIPHGRTGALAASANWDYNVESHSGRISVGTDYAIFVEFGTGLVGQTAQHPLAASMGYQYDANNHGSAGWTYYDEFSSQWWHTEGQVGQQFMYRTMQYMENIAGQRLRVAFKKFGDGF